jgi:hypothetical protein
MNTIRTIVNNCGTIYTLYNKMIEYDFDALMLIDTPELNEFLHSVIESLHMDLDKYMQKSDVIIIMSIATINATTEVFKRVYDLLRRYITTKKDWSTLIITAVFANKSKRAIFLYESCMFDITEFFYVESICINPLNNTIQPIVLKCNGLLQKNNSKIVLIAKYKENVYQFKWNTHEGFCVRKYKSDCKKEMFISC